MSLGCLNLSEKVIFAELHYMNKYLKRNQIFVDWMGLYMVQLNWIVFCANKEILF